VRAPDQLDPSGGVKARQARWRRGRKRVERGDSDGLGILALRHLAVALEHGPRFVEVSVLEPEVRVLVSRVRGLAHQPKRVRLSDLTLVDPVPRKVRGRAAIQSTAGWPPAQLQGMLGGLNGETFDRPRDVQKHGLDRL